MGQKRDELNPRLVGIGCEMAQLRFDWLLETRVVGGVEAAVRLRGNGTRQPGDGAGCGTGGVTVGGHWWWEGVERLLELRHPGLGGGVKNAGVHL